MNTELIIVILFSSSTLFNYPNFIKYFNIYNIYRSINFWKTVKKVKGGNFTVLIFKLLLKILHTFVGYVDCVLILNLD
jgi:hypothetical protein